MAKDATLSRRVVMTTRSWVGATLTNQVMTCVNICHVACHVGLNTISTNERLTRVICATWQSDPLP